MNSLNELFEQILHSEEHFSKRISRLRELGVCIQACQRDTQKVRSRGGVLKGELVVKNQRLADCEISTRLQEVKKNVLDQQKSELMKEKQQLTDNLARVLYNTEQQREEFLSEVKEFNKSYDLTGTSVKYREEQAKKKVAVLEEELELLGTEYAEIEFQQREVDKLELQLASVNKRLDEDNDQQRDLKTILQGLQSDCSQLRSSNVSSTAKLSEDMEFTRLQREIEACRNSSEEVECRHLTRELENLQRMSYQKQMKYHSFPQATKRRDQDVSLRHTDHHNAQSSHSAQRNIASSGARKAARRTHTSTTLLDCDKTTGGSDRDWNSSEKGVIEDDWMLGESECEDWELEALAEASELTALDLDDDSDVCILSDDEEEEETVCDNFTTNLKRRPLHNKGPPHSLASKNLVRQKFSSVTLKRLREPDKPPGETSQQLTAAARAKLPKSAKRVQFK